MSNAVHYKCPLASTCVGHKHCHVLKTTDRLKSAIDAIVKCPVKKNAEIVVRIGPDPK